MMMFYNKILWIVIGTLLWFDGYVNSQSYTACEFRYQCEIKNNLVLKVCTTSPWEGTWISELTPSGKTDNTSCIEGATFGRVGASFWVTKECHGEFKVCKTGMNGYGIGKCITPFKCNGAVNTKCKVGPRKKTFVTVIGLREQSQTSHCENFRRNGNNIFVDKTCDGIFTVCYANIYDVEFVTKNCDEKSCKVEHAGMIVSTEVIKAYRRKKKCNRINMDSTWGSKSIQMKGCVAYMKIGYIPEYYYIKCTSEDNKNNTCTDGRSLPASFGLYRELSDGLCKKGKTYGSYQGYNRVTEIGPEVWVSGGCSAIFKAYVRHL